MADSDLSRVRVFTTQLGAHPPRLAITWMTGPVGQILRSRMYTAKDLLMRTTTGAHRLKPRRGAALRSPTSNADIWRGSARSESSRSQKNGPVRVLRTRAKSEKSGCLKLHKSGCEVYLSKFKSRFARSFRPITRARVLHPESSAPLHSGPVRKKTHTHRTTASAVSYRQLGNGTGQAMASAPTSIVRALHDIPQHAPGARQRIGPRRETGR